MNPQFLIPTGTKDILPSDIVQWQDLEVKARDFLKLYGYREIRTPLFEETALFVRSMGEHTDVVEKQMLNVRSSKRVEEEESGLSLRPEGTAGVVRSYIENSLDKKESLSKLFYIGPMFRGERPQKGRLRQFHQIGVEAIGLDSFSPFLDAEVIALSVNLLQNLGLNKFQLKLNTLGTPEDKKKLQVVLKEKLKFFLPALCPDCQDRYERNVLRIFDCKKEGCQQVVKGLNLGQDWLSEESRQYFEKVKSALKELQISFEEDHRLVRGLDYYTHTVFEITDSSLGSQNALGAGGRYNNLVSQLGGADVPAIGFALGIERMLLVKPAAMEEKKNLLDIYLIALDEGSLLNSFRLVNALRQNSVRADMSYRLSSVKSLMRLADKSEAPFVAIIGENEVKGEFVTLKNMEQGTQEKVSVKNGDYDFLLNKVKGK